MKVIVTGGTGFLGRHLCKALNKRNNEVTLIGSKDADLTVQDSLLRFNHTKYDRIYHLAAWTQAGDFCVHHPGEQWMINQQINTTVLTWWHQHQSQAKLVSMGTSCSYQEGVDLRESRYLDGIPREELYVYAMTKRMLLIGQQSLHRQFGLNYLTLVPSTLYGPDYHTGGEQMHFIFDLIRKILEYKHSGIPAVLWGDGAQRRELVYVSDFVETMLLLEERTENDIVNIGAGEDYSIREFAELICEISGTSTDCLQFDTTRYVGAKAKMLSNNKLDRLLPNRSTTSLRKGLEATISWVEQVFFMNKVH